MAEKRYVLKIRLLSETLVGNAEGYGAVIDKDSVFDEVGLPVIPGKRVKGILREQAELIECFGGAEPFVLKLFGKTGMTDKHTEYLEIGNFFLEDYINNKAYLKYLIHQEVISRSEVMNYFSTLRRMTRIDDLGMAADTSLRTIRVLNKGWVFSGELVFDDLYQPVFEDIALLTRRIGSMRNRGLGHIQATLSLKPIPILKDLKSVLA